MALLHYTEAQSASLLADHLWSVRVDSCGSGTPMHWVLPDGRWTLSVRLNRQPAFHVRPPALGPLRASSVPDEQLVGISFRPGSLDHVRLDALRRFEQPQLSSVDDAQDILAHVLRRLEAIGDEPDERISEFVALTRSSNGRAPIGEIAEVVNVSERQLERICEARLGLTPKAFTRVVRLQAVVRRLIGPERPVLADVAAEFGYADQAHLRREFVALGELSPTAYLESLKNLRFHLGMSDLF